MIRMAHARALLVAAAAVFVLQPTQAQTLRVVMHSDLKVMDPLVSTAYIARNHGYMVWDQLIARDEKGVVRPQMAERWETSRNGLTWTFTLREGLEWHDGTPVTAEDCIASIRRFMMRDASGLRLSAFVQGFEPVDARTFRLQLKEPYGQLLDVLSKPSLAPLFMMPKKLAETSPATPIPADQVIGSGPFIFKRDEWKPGEKVVYVRNPKYKARAEPPSGFAGGKVATLERVEWIVMPDPQTALSAIARGEVDMVEMLAGDLIPLAAKNRDLVVQPSWKLAYFLRPNWLHPPLDNPKIRQAMMIAMDQESLLQGMVGGMIGPGPALTAVSVVTGAGFLWLWITMLHEAESG